MRTFAEWISGKEDERQRLQIIEDPSKNLKKRFTTLQQILKGFEKSRGVSFDDTFSPKQREFYLEYSDKATEICTDFLIDLDSSKVRPRLWEDVFSCLDILIEMARYGGYTFTNPYAFDFATHCLLDANRSELRDRGFRLLLNLLNSSPYEVQLRSLLLEAIDLEPFVIGGSVRLPPRVYLKSQTNRYFITLTNETLIKFRPVSPPYVVAELRDFQESSSQYLAQNTLHFLSAALSYAEKSDLPPSADSRSEHFQRWFNIILHPIFYLLYPSITPIINEHQAKATSAFIENAMGFHSECPLSLHFLIVNWLVRCIGDDDLRSELLKDQRNYEFVMDIIGTTFRIKEVHSSLLSNVVEQVLSLYNDWLEKSLISGSYAAFNFSKHIDTILKSVIQMPIAKSAKSEELWRQVLQLLDTFRIKLTLSRQTADLVHRPILVETLLLMAAKLHELAPKVIQGIIEPSVSLIFNLQCDFLVFEVPWSRFKPFLSTWAQKSEKIVSKWFDIMEKLTDQYKALSFAKGPFANGWIEMFGVLGDPLLMEDQVQLTWTSCVRRLIQKMLSPYKQAPTCNFLARIFFSVLASLIWKSEQTDTRLVALEALLDILVESRGRELPEHSYLYHFSSLVCLRVEEPMLTPTILLRLPALLEYSAMHIHIPKLVSLALEMPTFSLRLVFALMCFPNHYGPTLLLSYANTTNYLSLKKLLRQLLLKCCNTVETAPAAVYGLTVFIMEELVCGHEDVSGLIISELLAFVGHPSEQVASTALNCLAVLASSTSDLSNSIVSSLLDALNKQQREDLTLQILRTLQHLLINNPQLAMEHELVKKFYSGLHYQQFASPRLSEDLEVMVSFLMHYFSNFPLKNCPPSIMCSTISDATFAGLGDDLSDAGLSEAEQLHFIINNETLLSVFIIESKCRFILRNAFGRFAWNADNFRLFSSPDEHDDKNSYAECEDFFKQASVELNQGVESEELVQQSVLEDLISYILQNYPECYLNETPTSIPKDRNFLHFDTLERTTEIWPELTTSQPAKLNLARALMSHLNLIEEAELLEAGEQLTRAINELDKMQCREIVKLGVIYVAQGQQSQKEILANSTASPEFIEFIQSLGAVVEVKTHEGYLGGIDREGSVGKQTISHADWQHDVVYHVVPLMPTDSEDDQQINKKRHVGNDCVHIVWSEHWRDYEKDTITSHFNFTHIVVYPLPNRLYRIQIHMKHQSLIGPLQDGMVVSKPILVPLIVETAIQANNIVRQRHFERYQPMLAARIEKINDIKTRYSNQTTVREEILVALS